MFQFKDKGASYTNFNTKKFYRPLQWINIDITQFMRDGKYYRLVTINSEKEQEARIEKPEVFEDVIVYTSDKFFEAQQAFIDNINIKSGNSC